MKRLAPLSLVCAVACTPLTGRAPAETDASIAPDVPDVPDVPDAPDVPDVPDVPLVSDAPPCPSGGRFTLDARLGILTPAVVNALHPWFNASPRGAFLDALSRPVIYGQCRNCVDVTAPRAALWRTPETLLRVETGFGGAGRAFDGTAQAFASVWLTGSADAEGRLVVGGFQSRGGDTQGVIARFASNGAVDPAFAAQGRLVVLAERFGGSRFIPYAQWIDARGMLFVGTDVPLAEGLPARALALRLDSAGAFDPTFGDAGTGAVRDDALRGCFDVEPDGDAYVLACRAPSGRPALLRLGPDGRPQGFAGGDARREHSLAPTGFRPTVLERDGAGRWIVTGAVTDLDSDRAAVPALVRFLPDGTPDPSYGARGLAQLPGVRRTWQNALRSSARLHCDDRMLVGVEANHRPAVAVFRGDGVLDETVGTRGLLLLREAADEDPETYVYGLLSLRPTADVSVLSWYNVRSFDAARILP